MTGAENAALAFMAANQNILYGGDASQFNLAVAQLEHQVTGSMATVQATGPQLVRDRTVGFGDPRAHYGEAITRLSGLGGQSETEKQLQAQVALLQQTVANQKLTIQRDDKTIELLKQGNAYDAAILAAIATAKKAKPTAPAFIRVG